jgi:hypothetical protein
MSKTRPRYRKWGHPSPGTGEQAMTIEQQVRACHVEGYKIARRPNKAETTHNRVVCEFSDGSARFIMHKTVIAHLSTRNIYQNKIIRLDTGGYSTMTTRRAMEDAIDEFYEGNMSYAVGGGSRKKAKNALYIRGIDGESYEVGFNRTIVFNPNTGEVYLVDGLEKGADTKL